MTIFYNSFWGKTEISGFSLPERCVFFAGLLKPSQSKTSAPLLLYGIESNIKELDLQLEAEKDIAKRNKLQAQKTACTEVLNKRKAEVKDDNGLQDALDTIQNDDDLLRLIRSGKFDYLNIEDLLTSDLKPFFNSRLLAQLELSENQMITQDFVKNTLRPQHDQIAVESDEEWMKFRGEVENEINTLNGKKTEMEKKLNSGIMMSSTERKILSDEVKRIEGILPHLQKQLAERSIWTHKRVTQKERKQAQSSLLANISPDIIDATKGIIEQARFIRAEKTREYLLSRFEKLENGLAKRRKRFDKETLEKIENYYFANIKRELINSPKDDPNELKKIAGDISMTEEIVFETAGAIAEIDRKRPEAESEAGKALSEIEGILQAITPQQIKRLKEEANKDEEESLNPKAKERLSAIDKLSDPKNPLRHTLEEYKEILENAGNVSSEELYSVLSEYKTLKPKLQILQNLDGSIDDALNTDIKIAKQARQAISELEKVHTIKEIKETVASNIGAEHLEFVSRSEFQTKYRKYSPKGFMVFYRKGDEWKIIVDETSVASATNVMALKKQLTHELLHLEFDKNKNIRKEAVEQMTSDPNWPKIKEAYIQMAKAEGKKSPDGNEWPDGDIISELYAMQNEIGKKPTKGNGPKSTLNNLLVGSGLAMGMKVAETTKKYEDNKEEILGYTGGVDESQGKGAAESGGDASGASYDENKKKLDEVEERVKNVRKNEFIGQVEGGNRLMKALDAFNKNTIALNDGLKKNPTNETLGTCIQKRIKEVNEDLTNIEGEISKISINTPNQIINPLKVLWLRTNFIAVCDIVQTFVDLKEFMERRHERKKKDHASRIGMALFQDSDFGREEFARQKKATGEEVEEWKSRYEALDPWQLEGLLKQLSKSPDPSGDQFKAILRLLAHHGSINWRDEHLWEVINKLQHAVHLTPGDHVLLHNPVLLRQKLHVALGEIQNWNYNEFLTLERENDSNYDGSVKKFMGTYDKMQDQLTARLDQLLATHRGKGKVEPAEFESILVYSIENGKSYAENIMFHLICGMAEGLLAPDRGMYLDKYLNQWPATQWIYAHKPPFSRADYQRIANTYFKDDFKAGSISKGGSNGKQFKNYYWTVILNEKMTIERVRKSVGERKWDHDWTRTIACMGDADTAKRFFAGRSGQQETKSTAVENAYVGAVQWIEENAASLDRIDYRKQFARHAAWCAMAEGNLDGVAFFRKENDISTRSNESMENSVAREAGVGNHDKWTLKDNRNQVRTFLDLFDPVFFSTLRQKKNVRSEDERKEIGLQAKEYLMQKYPTHAEYWANIQHVDDVYSLMDLICQVMLSKEYISDADLRAKIQLLRAK
jgi:hypothetical protein